MKSIPLKNYFILIIIVLLTCLLTIFLSNFYSERNKKTSAIHGYIFEITEKELTDYIIEKPTIFMYISDKYDLSNNDFEKALMKEIKAENIKDYFVYLNVTDLTSEFTDFFKENYELNIDLEKTPILIVINDGAIVEINYIDTNNYDIEQLINYEVIK